MEKMGSQYLLRQLFHTAIEKHRLLLVKYSPDFWVLLFYILTEELLLLSNKYVVLLTLFLLLLNIWRLLVLFVVQKLHFNLSLLLNVTSTSQDGVLINLIINYILHI